MKKLFVTAAIAASAVVGLSAENKVIFDPKAGEHISIPVELLGEKGNTELYRDQFVFTSSGNFFSNQSVIDALNPSINQLYL